MPSLAVRVVLLLSAALSSWLSVPCYAGWGAKLAGVLPGLVKRAAVSLIEREIYDVEQNSDPRFDTQSGDYQCGNRGPSGYWNVLQNQQPQQYDDNGQGGHFPVPPHPSITAQARKSKSKKQSDSHYSVSGALTGGASSAPLPLRYLPTKDEQAETGSDSDVASAFSHGTAGSYSFDRLVSTRVFVLDSLYGSVFKRHTAVKYIILHSTETASPANAPRVIKSWNNRGLRHPGAQFVVDRDGIIYSTTNPDMATVHINTSKTLAGYSNDNSVGIEIVRAGTQHYTQPQLDAVMYLVSYLQSHYHVPDTNITTHHHVQPSDRSDPVGFDLLAFQRAKLDFSTSEVAAAGPRAVARGKSTRMHTVSLVPKPAPDFRLLH